MKVLCCKYHSKSKSLHVYAVGSCSLQPLNVSCWRRGEQKVVLYADESTVSHSTRSFRQRLTSVQALRGTPFFFLCVSESEWTPPGSAAVCSHFGFTCQSGWLQATHTWPSTMRRSVVLCVCSKRLVSDEIEGR